MSLIKPIKQIALVDCNNFYVSCERVFQPAWNHKPMGVLSNNDGCIVARSSELKKAGILMGTPYFKCKQQLKDMGAIITSSNYALYGDMSNRVMKILSKFTPHIAVYSIDEAWLDLTGFQDIDVYSKHIACYTYKATGIPVSVGVAPTKTLAKIMSYQVKKHSDAVHSMVYPTQKNAQDTLLESMNIDDVWGIGKNWGKSLKSIGIYTAKDLRDAPSTLIRKKFNVIMLRTQAELNGIVCFDSNDSNPKKQIISSRSFGTKVTDKEHLKEAIAMHIAKATRKLREQGSVCGAMVIKIRSSPFSKPFYTRSAVCEFHGLTSDTLLMTQYAFRELEYIYKPKVFYAKVGVMLCDIRPVDCYQGHLFNPEDSNKRKELMNLMDNLNLRFGKNTIIHGAEGLNKSWAMKNQYRTPAYTTDWQNILSIR